MGKSEVIKQISSEIISTNFKLNLESDFTGSIETDMNYKKQCTRMRKKNPNPL